MKQTSLLGIAKKAASDKTHRFQNLIGMLTVGYLLACWRLINNEPPTAWIVRTPEPMESTYGRT